MSSESRKTKSADWVLAARLSRLLKKLMSCSGWLGMTSSGIEWCRLICWQILLNSGTRLELSGDVPRNRMTASSWLLDVDSSCVHSRVYTNPHHSLSPASSAARTRVRGTTNGAQRSEKSWKQSGAGNKRRQNKRTGNCGAGTGTKRWAEITEIDLCAERQNSLLRSAHVLKAEAASHYSFASPSILAREFTQFQLPTHLNYTPLPQFFLWRTASLTATTTWRCQIWNVVTVLAPQWLWCSESIHASL